MRETARCGPLRPKLPGGHPWEWEYPGRAAIVFAAERDAHEGVLRAYTVPPLPPEVRAAAGDPGAREAACRSRALLPGLVHTGG
ncbi:MAG TPA: hypothetical protein VNV42_04480 [Solirubrobacteraceae bacterium]|jgi:hypothetical protein|nr:hypothetical protein [Solirubrobacteraceae bacterium]